MKDWEGDRDLEAFSIIAIVHDVQVNEVIQKSTHQVARKKMEETMFNKRILRNTNIE